LPRSDLAARPPADHPSTPPADAAAPRPSPSGATRPVRTGRLNAATGETEVMGGTLDQPFKDEAPPGGVLIGFEVGRGQLGSSDGVQAILPIFRTADGMESFGKQHGTQLERAVTVKAKPGYAVGAIIGKAGLTMDGFSVTFMAVTPNGLDATKNYSSEWIAGK